MLFSSHKGINAIRRAPFPNTFTLVSRVSADEVVGAQICSLRDGPGHPHSMAIRNSFQKLFLLFLSLPVPKTVPVLIGHSVYKLVGFHILPVLARD